MAKGKKQKQKRKEVRPKADATLKKIKLMEITYKNPSLLLKFMSSRFKVLPSSMTGISAKAQRKLQNEIKKARFLAMIPFTDRHTLN